MYVERILPAEQKPERRTGIPGRCTDIRAGRLWEDPGSESAVMTI